MIKKVFLNRNLLLVLAIVGGIFFPGMSSIIAPYTFWFLAFVMAFSLTGLAGKSLFPLKSVVKPMLVGVLLNHILFGGIVLGLAALFFDVNSIEFIGFVLIAATPPGVAIIPFTVKLEGNLNNAIIGTFAAFLASIFIAPVVIDFFASSANIDPFDLLKVMFVLIILPFIASRFLRNKKVLPTVEKTRGSIIDIGFSLIIYASIGINNQVFFSNFDVLVQIALVLFISMFVSGGIMGVVLGNKFSYKDIVTARLMFTIKSSGFAVVTAMELFGKKAAVPATVMSVFVLLYFFSLLLEQNLLEKITGNKEE